MSIAPALLRAYPTLSEAQRTIVSHSKGPLLIIAGPGSGKTFSLVLRAMNLLVLGQAVPRALVLCTFTEKAALELRDRMAAAARKIGYTGDLSELKVSTIHGLCNRLLTTHRHRTPLGNNYETLEELTQLLFLFEHFEAIVGPEHEGRYAGKWTTKWSAIEGVRGYFDKMTEELIDSARLLNAAEPFLRRLGAAYTAYQRAVFSNNRLDFAHQQRLAYDLLRDSHIATAITRDVRYVMVDEYQDTNFIQEQLLLKLSVATGNLFVVGDEDQSLYRFRGATVRNILEFTARVPDCTVVKLTTNYRSHTRIVQAYDRWMASADWSNPRGLPFRYDKTIQPDLNTEHSDYPAVFCIWGRDEQDEAQRFADMVAFLKEHNVITDYSQVALLLHSVRQEHSRPYLAALEARGIQAFCPRARAYFENDEVRLMVACLAVIFGYYGEGRGQGSGSALAELADYIDAGIMALGRQYGGAHPLAAVLRSFVADIEGLREGEALDLRPADYFYRLLALEPFTSLVKNENRARNLANLSQLLNTFQNYYHYTVVTYRNHLSLRFHLFNSFVRLLYDGGINEYEDPDQPFPKGHVQVMTIHQAKGLEFPVVVVGSLDKQLSTSKQIDRDLQPYYQRPPFEPESRITLFDRMRLHYVAFSRPEKLLVLTSHQQPRGHFAPIWQGLPQWPYVQKDLLAAQSFVLKDRLPVKRAFSFTGDLKVYETCPRQYQFFREYDFTPSRSAVIERLARDLAARFGRGFGYSNLNLIRQFYITYEHCRPNLQSMIGESPNTILQAATEESAPFPNTPGHQLPPSNFVLSWTHYVRLLPLQEQAKRDFYEEEAHRAGWSVRQLDRQINSMLYERLALSRNKGALLQEAEQSQDTITPEEAIRDPYILEFLGLPEPYSEKDLESALIQHLADFLLELGYGFTFVARQKRLQIGSESYYLDLLLYHRRLRCLVAIELKVGKFTHADAGQMNLYLNYLRENDMLEGEAPPLGLILCAEKDEAVAHYALGGLSNRVFASRYKLQLPDPDVLRREIEAARRRLEARAPIPKKRRRTDGF